MCDLPKRHSGADREPRRAVLDTQVVLDWLVFRDVGVAPLARELECGSLRWLTSQPMREELEHVLDRGVAAAWLPDRPAISLTYDRLAVHVEAGAHCAPRLLCSDPDDQMFIDLAVTSGAHWLFTRDRALLRLARRACERGVIVLRPADWEPLMAST